MDLKTYVRDIPDWPKEGVMFRDITPLLGNKESFKYAIDSIADHYKDKNIDIVLGAEARGFILASALAYRLGCGFVPARKPGKLPYNTLSAEYELEYGVDSLEMHEDAIKPSERVLVVDDVIATGGTAAAKVKLVEQLGGTIVGVAFLIELSFLNGRSKLEGQDVFSLITY
ncbi:MAG: adenine phosphoribosyltransferase [Candidatus Aquicultor secundus]|uniref:Adenine phosphoribosyltransferase n=1 Tax=Candidatus Aquicultor secundus TaxID=1973895 RepID=A0A2M7T589_9ACTN|nr:adenine phosphoribosyltransferase [Candidatus Aquicultor secundus]NCO65038.1 adenine phosphoribosyltransferase [Solirubrobacter sp.]OIO85296.1 MAG: adenine phosphoribosyltransferase [Candidatus Aquicultor secundus]PIU27962.1 MAG: adenine phosphoribosyltransferase [Candidatus Aquicultor secundus]PIW21673.1 MAG: adenine phosphoribosyltransferase [Candidatus Aquicultor secundus]PIX52099.1 MAG: adenine phosphoribosyltransferase [Candidatus Aquicultor secundus]